MKRNFEKEREEKKGSVAALTQEGREGGLVW